MLAAYCNKDGGSGIRRDLAESYSYAPAKRLENNAFSTVNSRLLYPCIGW